MRSKISVISGTADRAKLVDSLKRSDIADVVEVHSGQWADLAGSDVVVLVDDTDVEAAAEGVARRASGAVLLVVTGDREGDCAAAIRASLLPRPRVLGIEAGDVRSAVEAILFDRGLELEAAAYCRGELGIEDGVATVPVLVGAGGVRRIGTG